MSDTPRGLLKIAVTSIAEGFLSGPLLASFAEAHPRIVLDVTVTDAEFDIVAAGFDASPPWPRTRSASGNGPASVEGIASASSCFRLVITSYPTSDGEA